MSPLSARSTILTSRRSEHLLFKIHSCQLPNRLPSSRCIENAQYHQSTSRLTVCNRGVSDTALRLHDNYPANTRPVGNHQTGRERRPPRGQDESPQPTEHVYPP